MTFTFRLFALIGFVAALCFNGERLIVAQGKKKKSPPTPSGSEDDYYKMIRYDIPQGEVIEPGAIELIPDGKVAIGTRRGEIWMVDNAYDLDPSKSKWTRYAHGLHEILGLAYKDGWLYVTHRPDVSRIKDTNGDGKADLFEVVTDGWEINGDYHEYAFGSRFDKSGKMWFTLCLTGSFNSNSKFRGWAGYITTEGKFVPTTSGVRSPGGIGFDADENVFYTDNQGPWNGSCHLKQITVGGFVGHPDSFKWYKDPAAKYLGDAPAVPKSNSRIHIEAKKIPQLVPPACTFPYGKMGQSAGGIECDLSGGRFGPFEKQLFVGDQTHSIVMRVQLEKVNGRFQGACFPFRKDFSAGIIPVRFGTDGSLFTGGTARGWGSRGGKPFSFERLVWTGKVPFEIKEMHAKNDGFELVFTKPVDPETAGKPDSYKLATFTYLYRADYGSPEVDQTTAKITKVEVAKDNKSVRLFVDGLQEGHIHDLKADGVRDADGLPLLHGQAYYTMNSIPAK